MRELARKAARTLPGLSLCLAISLVALGLHEAQERLAGRTYLDALVIAILLGMALRATRSLGPALTSGIAFAAKTLLELAVTLLGASLSVQLVLSVGPALLVGIVLVTATALAASYAMGRLIGLPWRMAALIACGNSICGNSAIAAVAPVIGATSRDVAASITFTAVLGVVVVLCLPLLVPLLTLTQTQYGIVAGLSVYAVPQVLAATAPIGGVSFQVGTFVKLLRVLLLGPIIVGLSIATRRSAVGASTSSLGFWRLVPWFILGFLTLMALRSLGLVPAVLLAPIAFVAKALTILAMAALGLGVDVVTVARAGGRVILVAILSLAVLIILSVGLVHLV